MTALTPIREAESAALFNRDLNGDLRLLTCGSVDDGKSTLIGRLLWDASDLYDDQRAALAKGGTPDFSLLTDGLVAEREQGITIDIAWRYFDTATRRFVVIDSPGHEQYTRNMASGASHADVAIMLVDARHGVKTQTRRHAAILNLVGVKRVILAVNKMDLADWSEARFREIEANFRALGGAFGFWEAVAIPVSAIGGDNVARRSENMPWYQGPILLDHLERLPSRDAAPTGPFRMPVQTVLRDGRDFRALAGTVSSGAVHVGDEILDPGSLKTARVKRIATMDGDLPMAAQGQAVAIQLDRDIDVARGAVLAAPESPPAMARSLEARLVWLSETAFDPKAGYLLRSATDLAPVTALGVTARLDLATLEIEPADGAAMNDIVLARLALGRPVALDVFAHLTETGAFMLVDAVTGASVAGGVVTAVHARAAETPDDGTFVLTRAALERGLCADLGTDPEAEREFRRRADEAALLIRAAGVAVRIE